MHNNTAITRNASKSKNPQGTPNNNQAIKSTDDLYVAVNEIKTSVAAILQSQEFLSFKFDELSRKQCDIEKENIALRKEVNELQSKVTNLETEHVKMHQHVFKNVVTIAGVPYDKQENLYEVVNAVTSILNVQTADTQLVNCKRLINAKNKLTPSIYVEFASNKTKTELMMKYKENGPIMLKQYIPNVNDILSPLKPTSKIIFNNYICNFTMNLLAEAKKLKERYSLKYVWQNNGTVFLKQSDKSKTFYVNSSNDLKKIDLTLSNTEN